MNFRSPFVLVLAATLWGCAPETNVLPDGGHMRLSCNTERAYISIKVVDSLGAAVESASVTATNIGSGEVLTATTNSNGVTTAVGEEIGPGTIRVKATLSGKISSTQEALFTCGECGCLGEPNNLTLVLNP